MKTMMAVDDETPSLPLKNNGTRSSFSVTTSQDHESSDVVQEYTISQKETKAVFKQRVLVGTVLFTAALGICLVVYFITSRSQHREFKARFEGGADKILSTFNDIIREKVGAVGSLCLALTAHGLSQNETSSWPYVTMDRFQERAASARILSKVLHMSLLPIVQDGQREEWEAYSVANKQWYIDGLNYQRAIEQSGFSVSQGYSNRLLQRGYDVFKGYLYEYNQDFDQVIRAKGPGPYTPIWQSEPVSVLDGINLNLRALPKQGKLIDQCIETKELAFGGFFTSDPGTVTSRNKMTSWYSSILSIAAGKPTAYIGDPIAEAAYPIFRDFSQKKEIVAVMMFQFSWHTYFEDILPSYARGYMLVLENECEGSYTYLIDGKEISAVGQGDLHDPFFDSMRVSKYLDDGMVINDGSRDGVPLTVAGCSCALHVFPTRQLYGEFVTSLPIGLTAAIALVFAFTMAMFALYDRLVEHRQNLVLQTAKKSSEIVSSLFPENVRDRLLESGMLAPSHRLKSYFMNGDVGSAKSEQPIADLFPYTTVMFADISGFTAWSSTREPYHVFVLLQTIYQAFDEIAKKRGVFKVETIGDSYVAVTGLPKPQERHACIMSKFALECRQKMISLVRELEVELGPDTADLKMRFGLHSGPVTAGILKGDRARFQLFGDTVNCASRMESTGAPNKIQVSQATATLLRQAGHGDWLQPRDDEVVAKGKGVLSTFWIFADESAGNTGRLRELSFETKETKQRRLEQWITDLLLRRLKRVVARRMTLNNGKPLSGALSGTFQIHSSNEIPLNQLVEVIVLPDFDGNAVSNFDPDMVTIPDNVVAQLRQHISDLASRYGDNPFHNFEHACHVTMSVDKFLGRIVSPELDFDQFQGATCRHSTIASHLHDYTHGINSDPLTLFGIVYAALVHDLDHRGVSNNQFSLECPDVAQRFQHKSVAEQNSLDIAWSFLEADCLSDLQSYLFDHNTVEFERFRQVVTNSVLATDIFDKELNDLRKKRWSEAFTVETRSSENFTDRRATIVIEHIIQASDVSHTMQHWHIYRKWNERLFTEMYMAYQVGRMGADPSTFWYSGELGFFDNYIIPLAKKLKECNVFGVSSDECLTYALQNRAEWEELGEGIVQCMVQELKAERTDDQKDS